ncbi:hypothetical protein [Aerolutibacter daejeonensis]|uniref:hypothetical protein n=1 Tax=Aerolutibacter daejeonensis TaxID=346181 RepID=UPI00068AA307|nr:hypothetical protein [Lysobacter daejeonensis]
MTTPSASRKCHAVVQPRRAATATALTGSLALTLTLSIANAQPLTDHMPRYLQWTTAGCVALALIGLWAVIFRRSVALEAGVLVIKAGLNTRRVPAMAIELERARIIDLDARRELLPGRMTLGASLPGYQTGWFRTRQWGKGFYLLTERHRVLWLPERDGPHLLLSLQEPQALLAALNALVPRHAPEWPPR